MNWQDSEIVIVGAGGMGALFGSILFEGGLNVSLFDIDEAHVAEIRRNGLSIKGFGGDRTVRIRATADAADVASADLAIFQCKAYDTSEAANSVRHLAESGTIALSFQNGLGNEEILERTFGKGNVLGGLSAMAGLKLAPGKIRDFSRSPSYIGEYPRGRSERAKALASALTKAGLLTNPGDDITRLIWNKLLGNIAMSAVSGITGMTQTQCLSVPELKALSFTAMREAMDVANANGIELDTESAVRGLNLMTAPGGTGENKSSLCVDFEHRRRTEVDYIYGAIIDKGRQASVPTPTLDALSALVKGLEGQYWKEDS